MANSLASFLRTNLVVKSCPKNFNFVDERGKFIMWHILLQILSRKVFHQGLMKRPISLAHSFSFSDAPKKTKKKFAPFSPSVFEYLS